MSQGALVGGVLIFNFTQILLWWSLKVLKNQLTNLALDEISICICVESEFSCFTTETSQALVIWDTGLEYNWLLPDSQTQKQSISTASFQTLQLQGQGPLQVTVRAG